MHRSGMGVGRATGRDLDSLQVFSPLCDDVTSARVFIVAVPGDQLQSTKEALRAGHRAHTLEF